MRSTLLASTLPNSMTLRALPGQNDETRYFVSGEVQVEAGAGIGAGVLLRANPGCRIHIGRGACIGMGSVLHACGGSLIVEAGATLGMGVLVIGQGTIGKNACIGSETTVLNCSVLSQAVIPPRLAARGSHLWFRSPGGGRQQAHPGRALAGGSGSGSRDVA
jgi:carbon dioxide concentrating mechanism protein CcmN